MASSTSNASAANTSVWAPSASVQRALSGLHMSTELKYVDLALPPAKTPTALDFANIPTSLGASEKSFMDVIDQAWLSRKDLNSSSSGRVAQAVGTEDAVFCKGDTGLFGTVFEVWANHWILRTAPEDWWLPLITKIAKLVDDHADVPEVRKLFVGEQKGKKTLSVELPSFSIYDSDYNYLFRQFSEKINENIHLPGYVDAVASDFSTTSPTQCIASQITLMKSFQKYFDYEMMVCGCGIRGIEMLGTEYDWARLRGKLHSLRSLLEPVEKILRLSEIFRLADEVFSNLHRTYNGDLAMVDWWADVLVQDSDIKYGPSGMRRGTVDAYNGWLVRFLGGSASCKFAAAKLAAGEFAETLSCLSSCPMRVVDVLREISDNSFVVGGMAGFRVHASGQGSNGAVAAVPALQSVHGWCMMLPVSSPLRRVDAGSKGQATKALAHSQSRSAPAAMTDTFKGLPVPAKDGCGESEDGWDAL